MLSFQTIDLHAEGEPARVVISGVPTVEGNTMYEKRQYFMDHLDHIRKLLIREPRGYPCQNANVIVDACDATCAFGYIILEQGKIYPAMSGHNTICVATALLETGMIPMEYPITRFRIESPGGSIAVEAACDEERNKATKITLRNVFCFVCLSDVLVRDCAEVGDVVCSVAYGGMFYCIVDAATIGLELQPSNGKQICRWGEVIKTKCREQHPVKHFETDYSGCDILVFRDVSAEGRNRNAVVMSNGVLDWDNEATWTGMIDRSPCGTGTSAVMALLHSQGKLKVQEEFVHESIIGTKFIGKIVEEKIMPNGLRGIIPTISGQAWITQKCEVVCSPSDPFPEGYTVGDIWSE